MTDDLAQRVRSHADAVVGLVPDAGSDRRFVVTDPTGAAPIESVFDVDAAVVTAAGLANRAFGLESVHAPVARAYTRCHVTLDGEPTPKWADLSGYYAAAGRRTMQLHANFPHHARGVVDHLGVEPERDAVQAAILEHDPFDLEAALIERGMIAAVTRTMDEWDAHPHAAATASLPVLEIHRIGDGEPRGARRRLRVLDCSRVLAGPVAGSVFAAHGSDVLRVGAPHLSTVDVCVLATGAGKRWTDVDVRDQTGQRRFRELLDGADVWIDAFRPGAMAGHGLEPDAMTPGSIGVQISAFDWTGPWAGRRGFDSIVQTTTGIAAEGGSRASGGGDAGAGSPPVDRGVRSPRPLPVQALDYCTGLLAAFAARHLVDVQAREGGTWLARLSLLRTRNWLVGLAPPRDTPAASDSPVGAVSSAETVRFDTSRGRLELSAPVGGAYSFAPPLRSTPGLSWIGEPDPTCRTGSGVDTAIRR